ncbi:hypothetical protein C7M84_003792 [Penaeus vannamei]|uniref:Secreted protein n=1 Tax=Penaeus vannamei TaxID=6689 RepID=A0A423TM86_PENVA|nr:hypothetical protein C7M84_003792 [Penaeus vannamei]
MRSTIVRISILSIPVTARAWQVYRPRKPSPSAAPSPCTPEGQISTFTFLNFALSLWTNTACWVENTNSTQSLEDVSQIDQEVSLALMISLQRWLSLSQQLASVGGRESELEEVGCSVSGLCGEGREFGHVTKAILRSVWKYGEGIAHGLVHGPTRNT